MWDRSYRAHFSHAAETSNNAPSVTRTERRVIRRTRRGAKRQAAVKHSPALPIAGT